MQNVVVKRWGVNVEALDEAVRTALGAKTVGISTGPYGVIVHLVGADGDDVAEAIQIVTAHDPEKLTADQQKVADEQAALEAARSENTTALDVTKYTGTTAEIQTLAQKIAWLEKEINALQQS